MTVRKYTLVCGVEQFSALNFCVINCTFPLISQEKKKKKVMVFSVVSSTRTRGNGHRLENRRFCLNAHLYWPHFCAVWVTEHLNRLPGDCRDLSLEIFKRHLDVVLGTCFGHPCLSRGWTKWTQRSFPTSACDSVKSQERCKKYETL